jgi:transglutaminase-like putative cysteine protease
MFILAPHLLFLTAILGAGLLNSSPTPSIILTILSSIGLHRTYIRKKSIGKKAETWLGLVGMGIAFFYTHLEGDFWLYALRHWLAIILVLRAFRKMDKRDYVFCFLIAVGLLAHVAKSYEQLPFLFLMLAYIFLTPYALYYFLLHYGGFHKKVRVAPVCAVHFSAAQFRFMSGVSLVLCIFAALLFMVIPRPRGASIFGGAESGEIVTGMSESVPLGSFNRIRELSDIVMIVTSDQPTLWRGTVLDHYSEGVWRESVMYDWSELDRIPDPVSDESTTRRQFEIFNVRLTAYALLSAGDIMSAKELTDSLRILSKRVYSTISVNRHLTQSYHAKYEIVSRDSEFIGSENLIERDLQFRTGTRRRLDESMLFLQLPPNLPQRVKALAQSITRNIDSVEGKVKAVEDHLAEGYTYSLSDLSSGTQNPLEYFLFESRQGHCEYFASAMAILLRSAGVRTRVVQGFAPGTYVDEKYVVRLKDAHLWTEVFYPDKGWKAHDPTPGSNERLLADSQPGLFERLSLKWHTHVLQYNGAKQADLLERLKDGWITALVRCMRILSRIAVPLQFCLVGVAFVLLLKRFRFLRFFSFRPQLSRGKRRSLSRVKSYFGQYLKAIARKGYRRDPGTTPNNLLGDLENDGAPILDEARFMTGLFYSTRFGDASLDAEHELQLKQAVTRIRDWAK